MKKELSKKNRQWLILVLKVVVMICNTIILKIQTDEDESLTGEAKNIAFNVNYNAKNVCRA